MTVSDGPNPGVVLAAGHSRIGSVILALRRAGALVHQSMSNDFARQLESLQPQLLRFARTQLRNEAWAEDAVSETLVAALEKPHAFAGQSQLKTWLVGILKHKVIDQLRRHKREATILNSDDNEDLDDLLFAPDGHWREMPADWGNPDDVLRQRQFFVVMEACLEVLPPTQARVFMMREWLELSSAEVCKEMAITTTNLWVLLHRARLRLRECLQAGWFDAHPEGKSRQCVSSNDSVAGSPG